VINNKKLIQTGKKYLISVAVVAVFSVMCLGSAGIVSAFQCPDGGPNLPDGATIASCPDVQDVNSDTPEIDAGEKLDITIDCEPKPVGAPLDRTNCGIINLIVITINFLSALAGIIFVVSIMISGFQYMTARDNAGQIQKAKSRIVMTVVAVAIFIFMYALLNFLIPGGVIPQ
jgi:hypothetical protein